MLGWIQRLKFNRRKIIPSLFKGRWINSVFVELRRKGKMKKTISILIILISFLSCGEAPTQFPELVLNDSFVALNGEKIQLEEVLNKHKGKQTVINVWASWCRDCIIGMPDLKALQQEFSDTDFVFLSVDRNQTIWKRSIERYDLKGDHYFIPDGQKGIFGDFLNSNWIPRYMVIDIQGNIKLFKAKKANDNKLKESLR